MYNLGKSPRDVSLLCQHYLETLIPQPFLLNGFLYLGIFGLKSEQQLARWICPYLNTATSTQSDLKIIDLPTFQQTITPSRGQSGQKYSKCVKMSTPTSLWCYCSYALKWNAGKVYQLVFAVFLIYNFHLAFTVL